MEFELYNPVLSALVFLSWWLQICSIVYYDFSVLEFSHGFVVRSWLFELDFSFAWEHRLSQPYLDDWICIQFFLTCCRDFGFRAMEATNVHPSRISEFGTLEQSLGFRVEDTINLSRSMLLMFWSIIVGLLFLCGIYCFCFMNLI